MGTHLEPGTFNFITPAQHEPITTHRKKAPKFLYDHGPSAQIASPARPPVGNSRPVMSVSPEILVEIVAYGSQKDKLAWMLVGRKFVDPAERALWRTCGRLGIFRLLSMDEEKRGRLVKMISHLDVGGNPDSLDYGVWRSRPYGVQHGAYPDHIPMIPASWFVHPRLKSFTALASTIIDSAVDDVFARLKQASRLEILRISHHIERNTPEAFPLLLKRLPHLRIFEAHHTISGTLLPYLANMPTVKDITLGGTIAVEVAHQAIQVFGAFMNLETLNITLAPDAAKHLLPHLPQLKRLWIVLERIYTLSDEKLADTTKSSLQAIGAMSNLELLNIRFVYLELATELEPLKQLSSLSTLVLQLGSYGALRPVSEEESLVIIDVLRHIPLKQLYSGLDLDNARLGILSRACPSLRLLQIDRWLDLDDLDTNSPPVFPTLHCIDVACLWLPHPRYRLFIQVTSPLISVIANMSIQQQMY